MIEVFDKILKVAKTLFGLSDQLQASEQARRDRAAKLFKQIATCLKKVGTEIRAGNVPYGSCEQLRTYAEELPDVVSKEIGSARAKRLGDDLDAAHQTEQGAIDLRGEDDPEPYLRRLEEAAGKFHALANLLKAG